MALSSSQIILLCAVGIVLLAKPAHAFGAGNIGSTSKIEGQNWRHGDLEDTLLTIVAARAMGGKKFGKLDVKRVSGQIMILLSKLTSSRCILGTGSEITVKQLMSAQSNMSAPRPSAFFSGCWASCPSATARVNSK
jgi:hypothetical protein